MTYKYKPSGVCANRMEIELDGDVIKRVDIIGGCDGNSQGLSKIIEGMTVSQVTEKLAGIRCGFKHTSCPDQMAKAVSAAYAASAKK